MFYQYPVDHKKLLLAALFAEHFNGSV